MGKKNLSKAEISKEIRRIFAKHQVDLSKLYFNAGHRTVILSGKLVKIDGKDLTPNVVLVMTREILKFGYIRSELDNWYIGSDGIYYTGRTEDKKSA